MKSWAPLVPLIFIVIGLELLVRAGVVASYLLPAPSSVLLVLQEDSAELFAGGMQTFLCALGGLFLSFFVGVSFAAAMSSSDILKRAIYPYAVFFQTVPIIAIAPVLVIWFGFGAPTVIASSFVVSLFPIVASTLLGLQSADGASIDLFRLYRATKWQQFWKLRIPNALPSIFGGLRIAAGLAVIGAIVGEFVGGGGLGSIVDAARTQQRLDKVFAAVLLSTLLGVLLIVGINGISRWFLRHWHASEK